MSPAPDTPTGTVTCLFSDIEGSTRLELEVGTDTYRQVLETHRALLRAVWAAHGGHEQGTEGDSFFVIFERARDALAAAADGQRAIARETWPDGIDLRVRMGLNTGDVVAISGDVVGIAINRTARIAAVAHGGQILLGDATRALVASDLPDGVRLVDLGLHRLRDLGAPERLSQAVVDGLRAEFPPLRTVDVRPNNLPTQLTSFVGRDREVREAVDLLGSTRLLTLTGPGGTGKTRLSLQVAAALSDRYSDGVWFVALEPIRDVGLVAPRILSTMGVADSSSRPPIDVLAEAIGDRHLLFVLDNFEQVATAGPVVADLLGRCPNVTFLVTSRIALRVSGEQEYPVDGLPAPLDPGRLSEMERLSLPRAERTLDLGDLASYEAVRLFITRARAVRPGFELTEADAPAVAAIVSGLHGMPLAIELAAARIRLLSPEQIRERLRDRMTLLSGGARDLPERQQTLRGAIAWSYDLLDDPSKRLLDRLSVFRGGFDLVAVEAVCGPASEIGLDPFDGVASLVDQSLVKVDTMAIEPRFELLDTIAAFAAEMLADRGEAERIRERHAHVMLDRAEEAAPNLSGDDQRAWLDRLERDHDNLRAALDWAEARPEPEVAARLAFALWRFWQQRGYLNEARMRYESLAAHDWELSPVCAAHFAEGFGGVAYWQADYAGAKRWYERQLELWREIGDRSEIANALYNVAFAEIIPLMNAPSDLPDDAPDYATGRARLEEALAIYRELGDGAGEGNVLWGLGSYHYFTRDPAAAEPWYQEAIELHRAAGHRTMEAWSLHMLALVTTAQGRADEARDHARRALRQFEAAGDVAGITLVLDDLASIAAADQDAPRAGRLYGAARELQRSTGAGLADYVEETYTRFNAPSPRALLSPEELERYAAEGAAMALGEIVRYAAGEEPAES